MCPSAERSAEKQQVVKAPNSLLNFDETINITNVTDPHAYQEKYCMVIPFMGRSLANVFKTADFILFQYTSVDHPSQTLFRQMTTKQ
jgi:hypothetical protein